MNADQTVGPRQTGSNESEFRRVRSPLPQDAEFALCLTHDVDRPYKGVRSLSCAAEERSGYHLRSALSGANPYWQFDEIAALEEELGVRSAFYFLDEEHLLVDRPISEWFSPANWVRQLDRYDVTSSEIADAIRTLDDGGWEVGIHGSYHSSENRDRLREEKATLEELRGGPIAGGRHHDRELSVPETWRRYRAVGLRYDASLGSRTDCGFRHGYRPIRPFGDEFVAFPLTVAEGALPDPGDSFVTAREVCNRLLAEAAENDAVMTALWHPRFFNEREFPGYRRLYRWLVERALEMGAWVGPPAELYEEYSSRPERTATIGSRSG